MYVSLLLRVLVCVTALFYVCVCISTRVSSLVWFGLVSLFNGVSTFVGYLMPRPRRTVVVLSNL